jgi:LuxR family transcriptional regulator, maltose regulon positive regulatory protein
LATLSGVQNRLMARPLLATKLRAPRLRDGLVARPQLRERLNEAMTTSLALVSAPPGFGKSTLVAAWTSSLPNPAAWLSIDSRDNDPMTFWTYVVAAVEAVAPHPVSAARAALDSSQPETDVVIAGLLNDLAGQPDDVVLVLDDYHVIDRPEVHEGVAMMVDRLPPTAHVVVATRSDPPLPLARLRALGELVEIRAGDLRFTEDETRAYLNDSMGLDLASTEVAALEKRTEGWVAALQLAAVSMRDREDRVSFIAAFEGNDRYVVDYLADEVLIRQAEDIRAFLMETSILDRLTAPLCDAVTDRTDSRVMLRAIEQANLFLVALDDQRRSYRYHHLFADVLQARLKDEHPDLLPILHRRASDWFQRSGDRYEAVRHAFVARDFERAADLVELALPELRQTRNLTTMRAWLDALPDHVYRARPVLSVTCAGSLMANGEVEDVEARLRDAERWLGTTVGTAHDRPGTGPVVLDDEAFRRLPATIAVYRAAQAQGAGDLEAAVGHARRALDLADADDHFDRGAAAGFLALATWTSGDLETAYGYWVETMSSLEQAAHAVDAVGCIRPLAEIRIVQGRLKDAMRLYQRGLQLATERQQPVLRGAGDMHVGMSGLQIEWNELDAARDHLRASTELGDHAGLALNPYRWHLAMARIREIEGDLVSAIEQLDKAERVYVSEFYPDSRPVSALRARLWILQGRLADAIAWTEDRGLTIDDELTYLSEFEHIVFARVLIARWQRDKDVESAHDALTLLSRLEAAAELTGRDRSRIEVLVLQAVLHQRLGDVASAQAPLERALSLAERDGHVRVFVHEGAPMADLLATALRGGITVGYAGHLLAALTGPGPRYEAGQGLLEPLSRREVEVLRLLSTELDGPSIARQLVVGVSTVRSHTKSIYAKLGVSNRRAAVRRGEELGLLTRTRPA